ncbi:hypothetical protein F5148DRAFT_1237750 [Russula earlei]|uniref:Uncharacterized protein n=1 Tax=Russula earlei TaxID=71964 RepID=A0ACC0TXQ2_9AGAM|nr:hypothetical protein F5148DRAFT_1237750 [Russula earlei]
MTPWSAKITKRFSTVPANARENDFYAMGHTINFCIPLPDYTVAPYTYSIIDSHDSVNFIIEFEVLLEDKSVLFLEIKEPAEITLKSAREEADSQMRKRMGDLAPICPLDTLNGVSAFGTQLSFYTYDKHTHILPARIPPHPKLETDTAPLNRWDCNILEDEGVQRFQDLVAEIKRECEQV